MLKSKYSFDKNVSSQLKAFALVLMIMHHLWHQPYFALFEPIEYGLLLLSIGMMGKICVGMFLFCLWLWANGFLLRCRKCLSYLGEESMV